jgi:hypothetical protein
MGVRDLQTMDQVNAKPHARQKGLPYKLQQDDKKEKKKAREDACRDDVWLRDEGKSRASGRRLSRMSKVWDKRGEVHHCDKRSTHPETKYDPSVQLLLSKKEHALAEAACPNMPSRAMLEIVGPENRKLPQTFIWHDVDGNEIRRRVEK